MVSNPNTAASALAEAFKPVGAAARRLRAVLLPMALLHLEMQRGPSIGRKRRARRARGRRRHA
jgi:hypothetical protein